MNTTPNSTGGLIASIRTLGDGLLGTLQDRLELFSVELQEEKFRLIQTSIWISVAVLTCMMALAFASFTLVYLFWETARLSVLCGLTGFYTLALVGVILGFKRFLARQPGTFATTLHELGKDRECIQTKN